jgi:DNA-binding CsgD family transcriptional regulator
MEVLSARATDLEQDFPFSLVRQLFERPLAELSRSDLAAMLEGAGAARGALGIDAGGEGDHDSFAVLHGLYWITAALADSEPLLLAVDDLHLADAGSLDYLAFLLPRLEELPILLVAATRPDEPDPTGGVGRVLADTSVRHLSLAPLSKEAATELLAQELEKAPDGAFADACHEVTGGNPFLVRELGRSLLERQVEPVGGFADEVQRLVPERVARMVLVRIGCLSQMANGVGRALAILGDDAEPYLAAELADIPIESVQEAGDELRAAAILDPALSLRFTHPLVRNSVYEDIPAGERAAAHARAAALLRSQGASPEQIATQLLASDFRGERATVETLLQAGERALSTGAPRSAVAYLIRAFREPPPPDLRAPVIDSLLTAGIRAGDSTGLGEVEDAMLEELERTPSLRHRLAPQLTLWIGFARGRFDEASSLLRAALDDAEEEGDVDRAFEIEVQLSGISMLLPPSADADPEIEIDRYSRQLDPDSPAGRLAAAMEIFPAIARGTAKEAADAAERALQGNGVFFEEEPAFVVSAMPVAGLVLADELDAAIRGSEHALRIAREHDATPVFSLGWFLKAIAELARGDLVAAEADIRQALEIARLSGLSPAAQMVAVPAFVELMIERDDLEAAEAELARYGMADGPIPENRIFGAVRQKRGQLRVERGELERAAEDFAVVFGDAVGLGPAQAALAAPFAVRALAAVDEGERAHHVCEQLEASARHWGAPSPISQVLRAGAILRGGEEGIGMLVEAADMLEGSPRRLQHAHVLTDLGAALRRGGHRTDSRGPLRRGLRIARRCGAVRLAKRAHDELEASGETVRRHTPLGVESLTPSERRVAELAASGMTNRQIAQSLFVTVKTVEAHLSAAYDKLDIRSRKELAAALDEGREG